MEHYMIEIMNLIDPIMHISDSIKDMNKFCQITDETIMQYLSLYNMNTSGIQFNLNKTTATKLTIATNILYRLHSRDIYAYIDQIVTKEPSNFSEEDLIKINPEIKSKWLLLVRYKIGFSTGTKNPLDSIYFYSKKSKTESFKIDKKNVSILIPEYHREYIVLIFCKYKKHIEIVSDAFGKYKISNPS
jgi:hypothetical protein